MNREIEARIMAAKRVFVDVDDTLILWNYVGSTKLWGTDGWKPNEPLIEALQRWSTEHPSADLIVWSTGGQDYSVKMSQELGLIKRLPYTDCIDHQSKYPAHPCPGDLFIDDDPLPSFASATIHPREFAR